jgi:hypothetical protein
MKPFRMQEQRVRAGILLVFTLVAVVLGVSCARLSVPADSTHSTEEARSIKAFEAVATVLSCPRCANCHITGDSPLQGDDRHTHTMNVKRGPDGRGTPTMRCTNRHQDTSSSIAHAPPGAHDWRLPPPDQKMAWTGLGSGALARLVKDRSRNGNRSLEDLIEHVTNDHFIKGAWSPGPGRTLPPMSHEEFVQKFNEWVRYGAVCPKD